MSLVFLSHVCSPGSTFSSNAGNYGKQNHGAFLTTFPFAAIRQEFKTRVEPEDVIEGNDALMGCQVPSFVADLVDIDGWVDSEGNTFPAGNLGVNYGN